LKQTRGLTLNQTLGAVKCVCETNPLTGIWIHLR